MVNAVQLLGSLGFALAGGVALVAPRHRWWGIASAHVAFAAEVIAQLRYRAHDLAVVLAGDAYAGRRPVQAALIVCIVVITGAVVLWLLRVGRAFPARAAAEGLTGSMAALFVVEAISLHAVDAVLYRPFGPLPVIAWLWLCGAVGVALCAGWGRSRAMSAS